MCTGEDIEKHAEETGNIGDIIRRIKRRCEITSEEMAMEYGCALENKRSVHGENKLGSLEEGHREA